MHNWNFPLTSEGQRFKASRHVDNMWQFLYCYTKDTGTSEGNKRAFKENHRRWNLPVIGKYNQHRAAAMYDYFEHEGLMAMSNPDMVGAQFVTSAGFIDPPNPYPELGK